MPFATEQRGAGNRNTEAGLSTLDDTLKSANAGYNSASSITGSTLPYWQKILSGNRPAALQAVAPEANSVQAQTDAMKRQQSSMGTARGGGNAGANRTVDDEAMAKIDNLLFGVRSEAAQQIPDIGTKEAGINALKTSAGTTIGGTQAQVGQNEIQQALAALGLSTGATSNAGNIALKQEELNQNGLFQSILGEFLGGAVNKGMKVLGL